MLRITDPALKRMVLDQIVACIEAGGIDGLLEAGFSPEFLDAIRHRPARDLIKLAESAPLEFRVSMQEKSITDYLCRLDLIRRDAQLCEYFIRNGAATQLVTTLFRMPADDVRALRAQLLPTDEAPKRTRMPAPDVRDCIHARWSELERAGLSQRERIYELHQTFPDCRIDALCRTINEFSDTPLFWPTTDFGVIP